MAARLVDDDVEKPAAAKCGRRNQGCAVAQGLAFGKGAGSIASPLPSLSPCLTI